MIAGAVTPRMLSKQRTPHTIHVKTTFFSKRHQNSVYGGLRLLQVNGNVNRTVREEVFHWKSCGLYFAPESWPINVRIFSPQYFNTALGSSMRMLFNCTTSLRSNNHVQQFNWRLFTNFDGSGRSALGSLTIRLSAVRPSAV